jgi:hypothetical protein
MPINEVIQNGKKIGYRFGETGQIFTIADAGSDAAAKFKALMAAQNNTTQQVMNGQTADT